MGWIIFILGALSGVGFYRAYSALSGASLDIRMFRIAELYCLQMLTVCLQDAVFIKEAKYRVMRADPNFGENQVKVSKNEDNYILHQWKDDVIKKMIAVYPPHYRQLIQYSDWRGAMGWLNLHAKKILDNDS